MDQVGHASIDIYKAENETMGHEKMCNKCLNLKMEKGQFVCDLN